jgi:hypothetical protein
MGEACILIIDGRVSVRVARCMWIETQLDDLGMRRSIWQTLLSETKTA